MPRKVKMSILLCAGCLALALIWAGSACTPTQLATADQAVGGTPLTATTVPAVPPATQPTVVQPTQLQGTLHLVQDAAPVVAATVSVIPVWGQIAGGLVLLAGTVAGIFAGVQTSKVNTANAVIAAAAPDVAALAKQITITPAITALLSHPSAAAALATATQVAAAVIPAVTASPV